MRIWGNILTLKFFIGVVIFPFVVHADSLSGLSDGDPSSQPTSYSYRPLAAQLATDKQVQGSPSCGKQYDTNDPIQVMQVLVEGCETQVEDGAPISTFGMGNSPGENDLNQCDHSDAPAAAVCFEKMYLTPSANNPNAIVEENAKVYASLKSITAPTSEDARLEDGNAIFAWTQLVLHRPGWAYNYAKEWESLHPNEKPLFDKNFVQFFLAEQLKDIQRSSSWNAHPQYRDGWIDRIRQACVGGFSNRQTIQNSKAADVPAGSAAFCTISNGNPPVIQMTGDSTASVLSDAKWNQNLGKGAGAGSNGTGGSKGMDNEDNSGRDAPLFYVPYVPPVNPNSAYNAGSSSGGVLALGAGLGITALPMLTKMMTAPPPYVAPVAATAANMATTPYVQAGIAAPVTLETSTNTAATGVTGSTPTSGSGLTVRNSGPQSTSKAASTIRPAAIATSPAAAKPAVTAKKENFTIISNLKSSQGN
jgi:hypothetical protein